MPSHIPEICEALKSYHDSGEQIVLITNYDMNGIMTGVVGFAGLKGLGFNIELYKLNTYAYGIGLGEIDKLVAMFPDAKYILMGDVGINEHENVAYAEELGLHVLITDHHTPVSEDLPKADVCVDPMLDKGPEYFDEMCGAFVMYLILRQYISLYEDDRSMILNRLNCSEYLLEWVQLQTLCRYYMKIEH